MIHINLVHTNPHYSLKTYVIVTIPKSQKWAPRCRFPNQRLEGRPTPFSLPNLPLNPHPTLQPLRPQTPPGFHHTAITSMYLWRSPPSRSEVMNEWRYTFTSPTPMPSWHGDGQLYFSCMCGLFTALVTDCESGSIQCDEYKNCLLECILVKYERIGKNTASIFSVYHWNLAMDKAGPTETSVSI